MNKNYKKYIKDALSDLKNPKTMYKQIPNLLTLSRVLAPIVIIPLALTGNIIGSVIAASLFASTDFFDGLIARKLNITSELGRELDAVSDKVFSLGLVFPLALQNPIFFINILFECIIGSINLTAKCKGFEPRTVFVGKVKTFALSISIILGYLNSFIEISPNLLMGTLFATTILQTVTTSSYLNITLKKSIEKEKNQRKEKVEKTKELENIKENSLSKTYEKENANLILSTDEKQKIKKLELKKPR